MTQEDKQLLLKDLCARLPYGVKVMFSYNGFRWDWEQTLDNITKCDDSEYAVNGWGIHGIKPYLRPMSSMTKEEVSGLTHLIRESWEFYDYLNTNHFDYRGLIEKSLAIIAPDNMYK